MTIVTVLLAGGLLVLIVLALLAWPFIRQDDERASPDREVTLYEDQLAELDKDLARGVLDEAQASAAKTEIERRLLGALKRREQAPKGVSRAGRLAVIASMAAVPLVTFLIYLQIGRFDLPATTFMERTTPERAAELAAAQEQHPQLEQQLAALEDRLAENPEDVEGYALLARTRARMGDYEAALNAYQVANQLTEGRDAQLAGEMAEVMVILNQGLVSDTPRQIFTLILEDFPGDPQATYYLALAKAQDGQVAEAVMELQALRSRSPSDAPWLPEIDRLLTELAPNQQLPETERRFTGPSAEDVAAAQAMAPEDQAAMIEGMVSGLASRLEENPDDLEGWRRLARAYEVLNRPGDAANAHREVLRLAPDDPTARAFLER